MAWQLAVDPSAQKQLRRFPQKDIERIRLGLQSLANNPFIGDMQKMKGEESIWRRRVGSYRIKYELYISERTVYVYEIKRRGSNTY
ncbi:MAG: hypothetical protein COV91_02875 [Candidatus Taylorbacteria bacterium CG11_big_fil_rev_8_21_14_0_20_46_11]|uniref:Plasmid stabilization protein n=1 Tax=Candidatus Taylorbacteria bacterium CG11_big_fil_rev_8_21_14_0_20_46_11 TaxID=1975025 RepID=A0A2H0KBS1_9BACT|nr:MAG: hypothetical protein COV91_02875 [Candidatus Taylorbacteria bacterium CG11_big_fil_rev_8_21_14_0_20_46_11]